MVILHENVLYLLSTINYYQLKRNSVACILYYFWKYFRVSSHNEIF